MKTTQSSGTRPVHQTVAGEFEVKTGEKSIAIGFTGQRLSPHAGSATFWSWLRPLGWNKLLAGVLPQPQPTSNNHLLPLEKALAFMHGLLCDARKLTHVAYLRRDPVVPELIGVRRVASQSALSRFFQGFDSAGTNLRCFRPLWHWCLHRLPGAKDGCTLDLDSTRLLHEDGHQEGVAVGYTRQGLKPCLHPLLAVVAEVRLVAQLWLRPGNASCGGNVTAFFLDLRENLSGHLRLRGVRADAGFCLPELLALWEQLPLPYVVVAQLSQPIQKLIKGDLPWTRTEVPGTEVTELACQSMNWPHPRRLVLIRQPGAGRRRKPRGQAVAGRARLSLSSLGDQSAAGDAPAIGSVALLQRTGGLRECHQGTPVRLCLADVVPGKVLGQRSGVEPGHPDLQPDSALSTASGLAAEGDDPHLEILAVCDRRRVESSPWQDDN
jgi:hypothetical protein